MELRPRRYEQNKLSMTLMQNAYRHQANTLQTQMQLDMMKLLAILSKLHIEHAQNGATVQHIHSKQEITTICPNSN